MTVSEVCIHFCIKNRQYGLIDSLVPISVFENCLFDIKSNVLENGYCEMFVVTMNSDKELLLVMLHTYMSK